MTKLQHFGVLELPENPVIGGIYFLPSGKQYIINSTGLPIELTNVLFVDTLPNTGLSNKIYIVTENDVSRMLIWQGLEYIEMGGGQGFDASELELSISTLNSKIATVEGQVNILEHAITNINDGASAYQIALDNGFVGSETEWLNSLKGTDAVDGVNGLDGKNGKDGTDANVTTENIENALGYTPANNTNLTSHISAVASTTVLGHVKVDGVSIIADPYGVIRSTGGSGNSSDEKVKLDANDTAGYLEDKIDNVTLQIVNKKLVAMNLSGLLSSLNELNSLVGISGNVQSQIDSLSNITTVRDDIADTEQDLPQPVPESGVIILVREDSTQDNSSTFYRSNGTTWIYVNRINSDLARDFTINPINLITETTGILPKSRYEKQVASETSVLDTDNNFIATNVEGVLKELNQKIDDSSTGGGSSVTLNNTVTSTSTEEAATANAVKIAYDKGVEALNKANTVIPNASTTVTGIVKLNNTVTSTSVTEACTANSVKTAYDLANTANTKANTTGTTSVAGIVKLNSAINSTSTTEASTPSAVKQTYDLANTANTKANTVGTTSVAGIVKLNNNVSSTSTTEASTPNAVKQAYDLANSKASTANYSATIGTTWTGTVAPFTQTITVSGMLSSDTPFIFPVYSTTNVTALLEDETWLQIGKITTGVNSITVTCFEDKPTTALTIQLKVVR